VAVEGQQVDLVGLDVNWYGARRLRGIQHQQQVVSACDLASLRHRQDGARHIRRVVEDDHPGIGSDRILGQGRIEKPFP